MAQENSEQYAFLTDCSFSRYNEITFGISHRSEALVSVMNLKARARSRAFVLLAKNHFPNWLATLQLSRQIGQALGFFFNEIDEALDDFGRIVAKNDAGADTLGGLEHILHLLGHAARAEQHAHRLALLQGN